MPARICLAAGQFDVTTAVSSGLTAWARARETWRIEVHHLDAGNRNWLRRAGFAGLVAIDPPAADRDLAHLPFPVVCVHTAPSSLPTINVDDRAIGVCAARHLLECGYRRVAFIGVDAPWSCDRFDGFASTIGGKASCSDNRTRGHWPPWAQAQRAAHLRRFLQRMPAPVAIMAACDFLARMLVDLAGELELKVPDDVAVVGVDNSEPLCESGRVTISSVDPGLERMGTEAGRMLHLLLNGQTLPERVVTVPPRGVVQRRSTNVAAYTDQVVAHAVRLIRASACDGITVEDICRQLSISRRQLERRFLKHAGRLPGAEIRLARIARARELLNETSLPLTQIALRCGYEHLSSFSSAFRAATGVSPSGYRDNLRGPG